MKKIKGCGTALVTPFNRDGSVDHLAIRVLIKKQLAANIDFLVPLGTTGEAACLNNEEKIAILKTIVAEVKGKVPIIAGIGSNSTQTVIENIDLLKNIPLDGFLVVTPYYNKPTQKGLYEHFSAVAKATTKSIILYNVPGRTAVNLSAETTIKLAALDNIVATKEASSNFSQISEIIQKAPRNFCVLSGNDSEVLPLYALGAEGVISVASNLAPEKMVKLTNLLLNNNFPAARKLHHELSELFSHCFLETNPIPVKIGLHKMGSIANSLRLPLESATAKTTKLMEAALRKLKLL